MDDLGGAGGVVAGVVEGGTEARAEDPGGVDEEGAVVGAGNRGKSDCRNSRTALKDESRQRTTSATTSARVHPSGSLGFR